MPDATGRHFVPMPLFQLLAHACRPEYDPIFDGYFSIAFGDNEPDIVVLRFTRGADHDQLGAGSTPFAYHSTEFRLRLEHSEPEPEPAAAILPLPLVQPTDAVTVVVPAPLVDSMATRAHLAFDLLQHRHDPISVDLTTRAAPTHCQCGWPHELGHHTPDQCATRMGAGFPRLRRTLQQRLTGWAG